MPEEAVATPPSPTGGIDSFMSDFSDEAVSETAPAAPAKPAEAPKTEAKPPAAKPEAKAPEKPAEKPPEKKAEPAKEQPKKEPNDQLRARLESTLAENKKLREVEIANLQKENKELQAKRFVTPEMEKEIEENKAEITRLKTAVAESAYERSDEYKQKFYDPYVQTRDSAIALVEQLSIPTLDEEGKVVSTRKATREDWNRVARADVSEQAEIAQKLFGANALRVLSKIESLERIQADSQRAIAQHREGFEAKHKEATQRSVQEHQTITKYREESRQEIVDKFPQFFGEDANDPDAIEALKKGFELVDSADNADRMPPADRAALAEVIRHRAAWFTRGHREIQQKDAKIKSLEEELSKYRASDPGSGKEKPGEVEKKSEFPGSGLESLAAEFDRET